ncbi:MAG: flagellar motor switch protein FliM [Bacillota bacterium]
MSDILSQEEINALLSSFAKQEEERAAQGRSADTRQVRPYDFRRPDKLSKDQLRTIEMLHGAFARTLSSWMSSYLRTPIRNTLVSCEQLSFDEFSSSLAAPSVIAVFGVSPPDGEAILWFSPSLAFAILDRRLGGPGQAKGKPRELTDIEQRIMRGVILKILDILAEAWSDVSPFTLHLVNIVASPEFAQITADNETVGAVVIELALGDTTGNIGLCFPYPLLQPVLPRLTTSRGFRKEPGRQADGKLPEALKRGISGVRVPVVMELGQASILVGDFVDLAPGDIIRLDARRGQDLVVRIGKSAKFLARPGVIGKRLAFQVSRVLHDRGGTL